MGFFFFCLISDHEIPSGQSEYIILDTIIGPGLGKWAQPIITLRNVTLRYII